MIFFVVQVFDVADVEIYHVDLDLVFESGGNEKIVGVSNVSFEDFDSTFRVIIKLKFNNAYKIWLKSIQNNQVAINVPIDNKRPTKTKPSNFLMLID